MAENVALPETTVAVLREGRVIGHLAFQAQSAEPPISQIEVHFLAQASLEPMKQMLLSSNGSPAALSCRSARFSTGMDSPVSADGFTNTSRAVSKRRSPRDVLVVAPYNAQVALLEERLGPKGVRVGTVDKFH
jgi:hypothetical protein